MDGNVELSVHMTCIIGTFENPYTITRHIKQEKTTSVTGGTLIFVNLFVHAKYHRRAWHGITLPLFFFCFLFTYIVFIFNKKKYFITSFSLI